MELNEKYFVEQDQKAFFKFFEAFMDFQAVPVPCLGSFGELTQEMEIHQREQIIAHLKNTLTTEELVQGMMYGMMRCAELAGGFVRLNKWSIIHGLYLTVKKDLSDGA